MKKNLKSTLALLTGIILIPINSWCQSTTDCENYLQSLPKQLKLVEKIPQRYLMTDEYFNKDIYGNLHSKIKVTGEYTRGLDDGYVRWTNVWIAKSEGQSELYQDGVKQDYMENFSYVPSKDVLNESFFETFEKNIDVVFARNLIWDMLAIETFAWNYFESLQLNKTFIVPDINGSINMAEMGTYDQNNIEMNWLGISMMNNKLCAIIEYRAMDNKVDFHFDNMKSKGSNIQFGKIWVSLDNKQIEYAEIYSNTVQEIEIQGLPDKMLSCTKRFVTLKKIK